MQAYENGQIFFVGDIPLSMRGAYKDTVEVKDSLSTHVYVLNENALISRVNGGEGEAIFANAKVREALSLAIDRDAIAEAVVFARAATALVPYGVYDSNSKKDLFREVGGDILATSADLSAAQSALAESGITASDYKFSISVPAYDDVHVAIAEMVQASWTSLGFNVEVNAIETIENTDILKTTGEVNEGIRDDIFAQDYRAGKFEVAAIDYVAFSVDAFSILAPYAKCFTGGSSTKEDSRDFVIPPHLSGFDNEDYNALIESAYAEGDAVARAAILHEAETLLMQELPVIPIIFNQTATLESEDLSGIKYTYYGTMIFTKMKLKDYELYVPAEEE
jgi:dipeptide transport system substrate-binding protein